MSDPGTFAEMEEALRLGLEDRFTYHAPSASGVEKHRTLSMNFTKLAELIVDICPAGRERSLVLTKLEEAKMWASAAVARNASTR